MSLKYLTYQFNLGKLLAFLYPELELYFVTPFVQRSLANMEAQPRDRWHVLKELVFLESFVSFPDNSGPDRRNQQ